MLRFWVIPSQTTEQYDNVTPPLPKTSFYFSKKEKKTPSKFDAILNCCSKLGHQIVLLK